MEPRSARSPTWADRSTFPDFSPDGSRIVFTNAAAGAIDFDLFVISVDGTGLVQLTTDPANDGNPALVPRRQQIVFTSDRTGVGQVYVMDADGSDVTQLTFDDAWKDQVPDWSPDGSKIAYAAGDPGDILVMNADGTDQHTDRRRTDRRLRQRLVSRRRPDRVHPLRRPHGVCRQCGRQ